MRRASRPRRRAPLAARPSAAVDDAMPRDQRARRVGVRALAEQEHARGDVSPGVSTTDTCSAAHGSSPAPKRFDKRCAAAGRRLGERTVASEKGRAIAGRRARSSLACENADAAGELAGCTDWSPDRAGRFVALRDDVRLLTSRGGPSIQSLYAKRLRSRAAGPSLVRVSSENFTGSAASTNTSSSCRIPSRPREKRVRRPRAG